MFSSVQRCYMFIDHFVWRKNWNCKAPQICKISFIVFILDRFLCQRRFLQSLHWFLIGFSVCSARFLAGSGGFLLWFLRKRNTPTFLRNTAIERVIKLFIVCENLIVKFLECFWSQKSSMLLEMMTMKKRKETLRLLLGQRMNFGYRLLIYSRESWFLKGLF